MTHCNSETRHLNINLLILNEKQNRCGATGFIFVLSWPNFLFGEREDFLSIDVDHSYQSRALLKFVPISILSERSFTFLFVEHDQNILGA